MRFRAGSELLATWTTCGAVALIAAAPAAASAGEAEAPIEQAAVPNSLALAAPADAETSRVSIAQPVGTVTVGLSADTSGRRMFAARSQAGSAAVVSFSTTRPRPAVAAVSTGLAAPLGRARLTSRFGDWRPAANGGSRAHAGVDLAAPTGSPVAASMAGRVASAGWRGGYGLLVVVQGGNGLETRYAHLSSIRVSPGQQVRQGDLIGLVGSTGHSTGPHLHYEIRQNGTPLNPLR